MGSQTVARDRMLVNRGNPLRVDWGDASLDAVVAAVQPPTIEEDALVVHYRGDLAAWISQHTGQLAP
jgi:hypothetical protein